VKHAGLVEQRAYVKELSRGLQELLEVGVAIGERVDEQNEAAPRLQEKLDWLWQSTTHVTRQAGRVNEGYGRRAVPRLLGHVALREVSTRRFLRVRGPEVALSEEVETLRGTCRFALYEKREHLLGLKNCVSGKFLGISFSGAIVCASTSFGRWEEFDLDLHHNTPTAVLCVAANWGGGCWLRLTASGSGHGKAKRHLAPAEPQTAKHGLRRAARFDLLFLDDLYHPPSFAEQILQPRSSRSSEASSSSSSSSNE